MVKEQAPQFRRTLTLLPLVILGLAYMAPMTVFSTYGVAAQTTQGMIPAAYLIALTAMLFTACSYGKMVKAYPLAGSAYTYTQKTISPHLGFMVGWAVLMDYLFLPMINFLLSGIFLSAAFPDVPSWVWILLFIGVITAIRHSNDCKNQRGACTVSICRYNRVFGACHERDHEWHGTWHAL
jgi:putrescine importer